MSEFHFLRPWWLLALPVGIALILLLARIRQNGSGWRRVVDASLQPFVLTSSAALAGRRWPVAAAVAAWVLATVALAGPTWERLPVPAFRSNEALVVALDLSRSMDAADLTPSRLTRAKLKLLSLLERRGGGQVGLVVFSAHAFTVTPLTTDTRTISSLVGALTTDIMPSRGSHLEAGLDKAAALLKQSGVGGGEILLITDAQPSPYALQRARDLRAEGFVVHALGVGTADGAPIPEPDGGFMTDQAGRVVVPRFDAGGLRRLADDGGGRFAMLTADDSDLDTLLTNDPGQIVEGSTGEDDGYEADVWRDAGAWLAVLLLPLVALGFRRGWVAAWLVCVLVLPVSPAGAQQSGAAPGAPAAGAPNAGGNAQAPEAGQQTGISVGDLWQSLWQRPDQRGAGALASDDPARAARLFEDSEWRAAAEYRAGDYEASAASLAGIDTPDAHYNRGNALARAGRPDAAITAYDRALELNPDHADARYNRELLEDLLKDQESESPEESGAPQEQQGDGEQSGSQGESQGEQSGSEAGESEGGSDSGQQAEDRQSGGQSSSDQSGDSQQDPQQQSADAESGDAPEQQEDGESQDGEQAADEGAADERQASGAQPSPEELEQWASEQAAEQWLRRIPQDPGGLLRRKFLYQYQRLGIDQDGNYVWPGDEAEPW